MNLKHREIKDKISFVETFINENNISTQKKTTCNANSKTYTKVFKTMLGKIMRNTG